jgi:hypothetical protein
MVGPSPAWIGLYYDGVKIFVGMARLDDVALVLL